MQTLLAELIFIHFRPIAESPSFYWAPVDTSCWTHQLQAFFQTLKALINGRLTEKLHKKI